MTFSYRGQFSVSSGEEMFKRFNQANYVDCRINAYPEYTKWEKYGIVRYPPNFLFFDLDLSNFAKYKVPEKMLERALKTTLNKISSIIPKHSRTLLQSQHSSLKRLDGYYNGNRVLEESTYAKPTVLWTGNGYHVYLPISAIILDQEKYFSMDQFPCLFSSMGKYNNWSVSEVFLKYAENYFTNGKADPQHMPKYKTCLIRIPGSYNSKLLYNGLSKKESLVKVVHRWNGKKIPIQYLLKDFRRWLTQEEYIQKVKNKKRKNPRIMPKFLDSYHWIENLLHTPIEDHRKFCLFRILIPYLINVKFLSVEKTTETLESWLLKCNEKRSLGFNSRIEISNRIRYVKTIKPLGIGKLKELNPQLYNELRSKNLLNG